MDLLIILLILVVLVALGFFLFNRLRASPEGQRYERIRSLRGELPAQQKERELSPSTLLPGDAIAFSDGNNRVVVGVLECQEQVGPRSSAWRWSFLDDGYMLEAARDGNVLYEGSEIAYQGSQPFQELVADPDEGGVLKVFEQRVRDGTVASQPVTFEHAGLTFHLRSTGTFSARTHGTPPGDVWDDISPEAGDNVYFEAEAQSGEQLLGVWTSHIVLLVGRSLGLTDVEAIYPGTEVSA
jgi:hypothetical protein